MRWKPATRLLFRFCFVYFNLYCLFTNMGSSLFILPGDLPAPASLGPLWPMGKVTSWIAVNVFGINEPLVYLGNSRDTNFFWAQAFWLAPFAALAAGVWSVLDRRRENYLTLHKWFWVFLRFGVAAQMFYFGMVKVIPTQFPRPSLITLVTPVGNLSLQGLLWTQIGASPVYQIFTGFVEVLGGILLLIPRTTMFGAIICLATVTHIFILNMTYDVGVKLLSFHLILMCLFLLAPDVRRLANFFFLDRPAGISTQPRLFRTDRANRIALALQVLFGLYLLGIYTNIGWRAWYLEGGGGSPKSPLYGIWEVERLSVNGRSGLPDMNDYDRRWRRAIFDSPDTLVFQRTDQSFARYGASINVYDNTVTLTKGDRRNWQARFSFSRPARDRLILDGEMDGHGIHAELALVEFDVFRLLNSHFRWMRPPDPS
jgi:hypothetical protein